MDEQSLGWETSCEETAAVPAESVKWYQNITLDDARAFIRENIVSASRSFVAVGYYLKFVRDRDLYRPDGYSTIWEFADAEYGISKSTASRYMAMNDRFSLDGNSPYIAPEYKDFGRSHLQEMLYLTDEQLEQVAPDMQVRQIREIRKPEISCLEMPGQFSVYDFPDMLPDDYVPEKAPEQAEQRQTIYATFTAEDLIGTECGAIAMSQQTERPTAVTESEVIFPEPNRHEIKTLPWFFEDIIRDLKRFELRKNDRDYTVGDIVVLQEWNGAEYTGREREIIITYVLKDCPEYGLMDGYCIFGWQTSPQKRGGAGQDSTSRRHEYEKEYI